MNKFIAGLFLFSGIFFISQNTIAKFADIDTTHPYYQAIASLEKSGVVQGYQKDGKKFFKSLQKISRAEALKVLLLSADIDLSAQRSTFEDVAKGEWFEPYVATAKSRGFVKGFSDGNFHPHAQVSRAEFLKMAAKAFEIPIEISEEGDAPWYEIYFDFARLFKVFEEETLDPHESLSRGELAEIIFRFSHIAQNEFTQSYIYSGGGAASYYNEGFAGKLTANGEIYDPMALTAAHRTLPFGTRLKVWTNNNPDEFVVVRINDRGPYHSSRIIDLSEKAFSMLAPISRGVIEVDFEIFLENKEEIQIPAEILQHVSAQAKNAEVPDEVKDQLQSYPEEEKTKYKTPEKKEPTPVFEDTVSYLSTDFFPNITLRDSFPQRIKTGSVLNLSGISHVSGYKKVTVFLQPLDVSGKPLSEVKQTLFSGAVSDKNFSLSLSFLNAGEYHMGIVFDEQKKSRVANIKVTKEGQDTRYLGTSDTEFPEGFRVNLVPEEKKIKFSWELDTDRNQLTKIVLSAPGSQAHSKTLLIEHGIHELFLDYDFFEHFIPQRNASEKDILLLIDIYGAESTAKTLNTQTTNWEKIEYQNFLLVPGFHDSESKKVSIYSFPRFPKTLDAISLSGKILDSNTTLSDHIFLTTPSGKILKIPVIMQGQEAFQFRILPSEWGTHVLEITSTEGEILFNRAIYISEEMILPVQPWKRIFVRSTTTTSVRNWVNSWRSKKGVSALTSETALDSVAQKYANQMAAENFISHTSPTGRTFEDRIKAEGLQGEFAENLSFGTTLDLALDGLQDSASHFRQIISPQWRNIGIGIAKNKEGFYVVQVFGR